MGVGRGQFGHQGAGGVRGVPSDVVMEERAVAAAAASTHLRASARTCGQHLYAGLGLADAGGKGQEDIDNGGWEVGEGGGGRGEIASPSGLPGSPTSATKPFLAVRPAWRDWHGARRPRSSMQGRADADRPQIGIGPRGSRGQLAPLGHS